MFFSLSKNRKDNFSHQWVCDQFYIGTDAGWTEVDLGRYWVLYKGYSDDHPLVEKLQDIVDAELPILTGNFCVLVWDRYALHWQIKHDIYRGFPLFCIEGIGVTNWLQPTGSEQIHTNNSMIWDSQLKGRLATFNVYPTASVPTTVNDIHKFLTHKITQFCDHNRLPIKIYLSGGVDTLLFFSFLKKLDIDFELVMAEHLDLDEFVLRNWPDIPNWSYRQIHHWRDPCVLASGAPGDEFTLRSPTYLNWFAMKHGQDIRELTDTNPRCLHYQYFKTDKSLALFEEQSQNYHTIDDLRLHVMNIIVNDYQHYHIGHTLTWTPLRDLRLFDMFLNLPVQDQIDQMLDSSISKEIIEMNVPGLCEVISDQKNHDHALANLTKLQKYHTIN